MLEGYVHVYFLWSYFPASEVLDSHIEMEKHFLPFPFQRLLLAHTVQAVAIYCFFFPLKFTGVK